MKFPTTIAALLVAFGFMGCRSQTASPPPEFSGEQSPAMISRYASAEDAANALIAAAQSGRENQVRQVLGPGADQLSSGDPIADRNGLQRFAQAAAEQHHLEPIDANTQRLVIGPNQWPTPIPIVRDANGQWHFDTSAGIAEILARRIGRNELNAIATCRAYVEAQREYAATDRDGDQVLEYAQKFVSDPGRQNGLYWTAQPNEEQSPLGPLVAQASAEGYSTTQRTPYHGYYYRILTRQGGNVPGGAYDYVINGNMIAGFAMVAWPAKYGSSGIMTFVVNHNGRVYQKDLGPDTDSTARKLEQYNPDRTWTVIRE